MAVRSKSNYKSTKDLIITTNGVGDISGADVNSIFENSADSFVFNNGTSTINSATWDGSYVSTSGVDTNLTIQPTVNQASGTGGSTALKINVITTTLGSGVHNILQLQDTGTNKFLVNVDGTVTVTNKIVSVSNGNIDIEPNGTGNVLLGNFTFDADQSVGAGQDNFVLTYDDGTGLISLEAAAGGSGAFTADGDTQITETTPILLDQATGDEVALSISPTINKATSGNYTGIKVDVTETVAPGSNNLLIDLQVASSSVFSIDNDGQTVFVAGSAAKPAITFLNQVGLNTGFYGVADKTIGVTINAVNQWQFGVSDIRSNTSSGAFLRSNAAIGVVHSFLGDNTSGLTRISAGNLSIKTANVVAINFDANQITTTLSQLKTTTSTTLAAINMGSFAGDPSVLADGDYWTNSSTNKLRARENGASVNVIGGGFANNANNTQLAKSDGTDLIDSGISIPSNGNIDLSGSVAILGNSTTNGTVDIRPDGSGDIQLTRTNDAGSRLIMQNASAGISFEFNATGLGVFGVTPIAQPSAYTRNATIVEDKTLLASASATVTNNNNVLAALINDLQLLGWVG